MKLPTNEDRTLVLGRTGSGKTFAGLFLLSEMDLENERWVIIDYKRDKNIARIPYARYIPVGTIPIDPGVYIVQPMLADQDAMEEYLEAIWEHENIGIFVDEGVMLADSNALNTILIQGRSKHIPVIVLSQRPVGISRYAFSEAQVIMVFPSNDRRDQKTVSEFTPLFQTRNSADARIPRFHSYYFHVSDQELSRLGPVPPIEKIMETFAHKLEPPEPAELTEQLLKPPSRTIVKI